MNEHTPESAAPTERVAVPVAPAETEPFMLPDATVPAPWGSRRAARDEELAPVVDADEADDEPFVPARRWRAGRLTKVLVCVCLVLAGGLGGAALQKGADSRTGVTGRAGQYQVGTGGAGDGNQTGGFGGRTRSSQGATGAQPSTAPPAP